MSFGGWHQPGRGPGPGPISPVSSHSTPGGTQRGRGGPFVGGIGSTSSPGSASLPVVSSGALAHIPEHLSFVFRITLLDVDFNKQKPRYALPDRWLPPTKSSALAKKASYLFRWKGGIVTRLADDSRIGKVKLKNLEEHSAATVFTQNPSSHHLLAVACDAQTVDLYRPEQVWRDLSFDHIGASDRGGTYSYLTIAGDQRRIAAPATSHWANQLLLPVYNYQASEANPQGPSRTTNAGLIGRLPLLLALAVFTCPESVLAQVLIVCMQPGAWRKHQWTFPEGHNEYRGMVVTVYYDPENPRWSTEEKLGELQDGDYGPFYGPAPPASSG